MRRIGNAVRNLTTMEMLRIERRRLVDRPADGEPSFCMGTLPHKAICVGNAAEILSRVKALMLLVVDAGLSGAWPTEDEWMRRLPDWFLRACAPECTVEEGQRLAEALRRMSDKQRMRYRYTEKWSARGWLWQMEPGDLTGNADRRERYWWDAEIIDPYTIETSPDLLEFPCGFGGFSWMYSAAGALDIDEIPP